MPDVRILDEQAWNAAKDAGEVVGILPTEFTSLDGLISGIGDKAAELLERLEKAEALAEESQNTERQTFARLQKAKAERDITARMVATLNDDCKRMHERAQKAEVERYQWETRCIDARAGREAALGTNILHLETIEHLATHNATLRGQVEELRESLKRYGHHAENCNENRMRGLSGEKVICNCGLATAFAESFEGKK